MRRYVACLSLAVVLHGVLLVVPALSALDAVSGRQAGDPPALTEILADGDPTQVGVSLANGFPVWYRDVPDGLKLQLCLDTALEVTPGEGWWSIPVSTNRRHWGRRLRSPAISAPRRCIGLHRPSAPMSVATV